MSLQSKIPFSGTPFEGLAIAEPDTQIEFGILHRYGYLLLERAEFVINANA